MGSKMSKQRASRRRLSIASPPLTRTRDVEQVDLQASQKQTEKELQVSLNNIEEMINSGNFATAVELGSQVVQHNKSLLGVEHSLVLSSMFELGRAFHGDRRVEKALQKFQDLLPLSEKVLGLYHTRTLDILDAIAEELYNMGKHELALAQLNEERQRCEKGLGLEHERTIQVLIDIANLSKILRNPENASSILSLALDRSQRTFGPSHELTLAVLFDLRQLQKPVMHNLEEMKAVLRQNNLPIFTEPFPNFKSASLAEILGVKSVYTRQSRSIPNYYADPTNSKSKLGSMPIQVQTDSSFQSLISRSIAILVGARIDVNSVMQRAVESHVTFLKRVNSLDELLIARGNRFWFFQIRESFMGQSRFQRWDPESLDRYVLLPIEGGFVNPENCIFISHYWQTQADPDPEGKDLQTLQELLREGYWNQFAYLWIDWTCLPQQERSAPQQRYFSAVLPSIPKLVRHCEILSHFPKFQPRLWVLFEIATFTFNGGKIIGLPVMNSFERHLLQMHGHGVRLVLDRYSYDCRNKEDREWIITSLEILVALHKAVPSVHSRRQILDAIDNPIVRSVAHQGLDLKLDKERGTLKTRERVYQFNPYPVDDEFSHVVSEVSIPEDYSTRLQRALQWVGSNFDEKGVGEIAREYDRMGDYKIAEVLFRRAFTASGSSVASEDLIANLEKQERFEEAAVLCRQETSRPGMRVETQMKLLALQQKQQLLGSYIRWKVAPLEASIRTDIPATVGYKKAVLRNGLRRSWLQRLDQSVFKSEDPMVMKSMEEQALDSEQKGLYLEAKRIHWSLLGRRRDLLGPCHVDTRRSLSAFARVAQSGGSILEIQNAIPVHSIALAVSDFTLGPWHPESRTKIGDLATAILLYKRPTLARGYYRQQLERTLAIVEWHDPEAFVPKFFLHPLVGDSGLKIKQVGEATTVILEDQGIPAQVLLVLGDCENEEMRMMK